MGAKRKEVLRVQFVFNTPTVPHRSQSTFAFTTPPSSLRALPLGAAPWTPRLFCRQMQARGQGSSSWQEVRRRDPADLLFFPCP